MGDRHVGGGLHLCRDALQGAPHEGPDRAPDDRPNIQDARHAQRRRVARLQRAALRQEDEVQGTFIITALHPPTTHWPHDPTIDKFVLLLLLQTYPSAIRQRMFSATTDAGFDLLMSFLAYDPKKRITAREALSHRYFTEPPLPREPGMIQTFPSLHEVTLPHSLTAQAVRPSRSCRLTLRAHVGPPAPSLSLLVRARGLARTLRVWRAASLAPTS